MKICYRYVAGQLNSKRGNSFYSESATTVRCGRGVQKNVVFGLTVKICVYVKYKKSKYTKEKQQKMDERACRAIH